MPFNHVGTVVPLPDISSKEVNGKRFYETSKGFYPSVTTVVGHQSAKSIQEWRERVGADVADRKSRSASIRGTRYHGVVEAYLKNELEEVQKSEGLAKYLFGVARSTLDLITDIHILEAPLVSHDLRIAGRVDCIASYDGELAIIDFKTTGQLKKKEYLEKYFVQEAAYAYMYYEMTGVEVDKLVTISVSEDGLMQVEQRYDKIPYMNTLIDWIKDFRYYQRGIQ